MNAFDEIAIEEVYDHENLDEIVEMRPEGPEASEIGLPRDFYAGLALRDNYTREMAGLADWQSDFPVDSVEPKRFRPLPMKGDGFDPDFDKMTIEEILSIII